MKSKTTIGLMVAALLLVAPLTLAQTSARGIPLKMVTKVQANLNKTATFNSASIDLEDSTVLVATLVSNEDVDGSTLDVTIETSADNSTWVSSGTTFTQRTATGNELKSITNGAFHRYIRFAVTIGGGGGQWDATFHVTAKPKV